MAGYGVGAPALQAGTITNLGVAELIVVPVVGGETSKVVPTKERHFAPYVGISADYNHGGYVTDVSQGSVTIAFTDPGAAKTITLLVLG